MTQLNEAISPLRQRMIDDMNMRKLSPKTQIGYIRAVAKLSEYLKHSPAHATSEELRQFQSNYSAGIKILGSIPFNNNVNAVDPLIPCFLQLDR